MFVVFALFACFTICSCPFVVLFVSGLREFLFFLSSFGVTFVYAELSRRPDISANEISPLNSFTYFTYTTNSIMLIQPSTIALHIHYSTDWPFTIGSCVSRGGGAVSLAYSSPSLVTELNKDSGSAAISKRNLQEEEIIVSTRNYIRTWSIATSTHAQI